MIIEYTTLTIYLIVLMVVGAVFSRLNSNVSDFARGGAKATWWMVGTSMFMAGISAFTFTGNASAAFLGGPTFLVMYIANCVGLIACIILGPWFRQTRATTWGDLLRERFNVSVEQFGSFFALLLQPISAATQLYALSIFTGSVLDVPTVWVIVVLGFIVLFYSTTGGRWAVMATDFVQGVVLLSLTVLVFFLALHKIGGVAEFFSYFSDPRFADDFKLVKSPGDFPNDQFTWKWIIVIFLLQLQGYINLGTASRFLSAKDSRHARLAAIWACFLMGIGTIVWFVPPMVARFLFESEVLSQGLKEPATASYAVIAQNLLPNGLMGLMLAAMLAATMSSMDTGLNNTTGIIVNNILPRIRERMKLKPLADARGLFWCRVCTVILGIYIILVALMLAFQTKVSLFDAYLMIAAVVGLPLGMPILFALWIKRLHWTSFYIIILLAIIPSAYFVYQSSVGGENWPIQDRLAWVYGFSLIGCLISLPVWKFASAAYKKRVDDFYVKMHTPVDFESEVGGDEDVMQYKVIGWTCVTLGTLTFSFLFLSNSLAQKLQILLLALSILSVGGGLLYLTPKVNKADKPSRSHADADQD
jgi:Na+/proline symporter